MADLAHRPSTTSEPAVPRPELIHAMVAIRPGGLTWRRTFMGRLDQAPRARQFVRFLLDDSPCREDAELVVSELVGNAMRHTASGKAHGSFIVEVIRKTTTVRVAVYDCGWGGTPKTRRQRCPAGDEENGRGLLTVAALASEVGYRGTQAVGHVVWAQFDLTSP
ncbi:ATP-binding protein [Streptosporangium sp. H16]|uniref:ATP-binding protein n=1 Tax=Streptosporangium sp. H16 TaxID=3444184 RepID=UPI003F7AE288